MWEALAVIVSLLAAGVAWYQASIAKKASDAVLEAAKAPGIRFSRDDRGRLVVTNHGPGTAYKARLEGSDLLQPIVPDVEGTPLPPGGERTYWQASSNWGSNLQYDEELQNGINFRWEDVDGKNGELRLTK